MRRILDDRRRVAIDLNCVKCGYNVRTLHDEGRCPECGEAVGETVRRYRQRFDRRERLRAVGDGIATLLGAVWLISLMVLMASWKLVLPGAVPPELAEGLSAFGAVFGISGAIVALVGLGRISDRDPAELESPKRIDVRSVLRACLWAIPLIPILGLIAGFVWVKVVGNCAAVALLAYLIVFPAATFVRIAQLMRECDDEKTAAFAATMGLTTVLCEIAVVVGWYLNSQSPFVFDVVSRAAGVALLLTTIATIVLLVRANRTALAMIERIRVREPKVGD